MRGILTPDYSPRIRFSTVLSMGLFVVFSLVEVDLTSGDSPPPQQQLKAYALRGSPNSADISPDEQFVVTESTVKNNGVDPGTNTFAEVVRAWNFRESTLMGEFVAQRTDVRADAKGAFADPVPGPRYVRFSPDGRVVAALVNRTIHVLSAKDLTELRTIPLVGPSNTTHTFRGTTFVSEPDVRAAEISPNGNVIAILWVSDLLYGRVELYDLSSGTNIQSWDTPIGWIQFTKDLVWRSDGKLLFLAIPNETPCSAPSGQPDVFAFDVRTGAVAQRFTTGLLAGSVAIGTNSNVLAVDLNCLGVFKNHDPKLRVFDLTTGKHLRDVSGRGAGVRYWVSASADGSRFLAFTGKMKAKFDLSDGVPYDSSVDETFSVWNLKTYEGIVTSQNIPGLKNSVLRLSSKGRYAVSYGKASFVYELPQ
jgi:WD40 repeat protein